MAEFSSQALVIREGLPVYRRAIQRERTALQNFFLWGEGKSHFQSGLRIRIGPVPYLPDTYSLSCRIRIRIQNTDPDTEPGVITAL